MSKGSSIGTRLILAIDGKKVFEDEIGGPEDVEAVDLRQAAAVAEINGRFKNIRVPMTAGPHTIAATFVARTMAESDAVLQPFVPGGGEVGIIEGEESPLKIQRLEINGPFNADGRERDAEPRSDLHLPAAERGRRAAVRARDRHAPGAQGVSAARDGCGSRDAARVLRAGRARAAASRPACATR